MTEQRKMIEDLKFGQNKALLEEQLKQQTIIQQQVCYWSCPLLELPSWRYPLGEDNSRIRGLVHTLKTLCLMANNINIHAYMCVR